MSDELPDDAAATPSVTPRQRNPGGEGRWTPPSPEHLQLLLPQYEVIEMLGHGGMGAVYKARQISLDRLVAIKILPPEILGDEDANFVERFKNEARTMARMNHPGIVAVHDFGQAPEGQLYFVMEFVDGTDVAKMLRSQGRLSADYALAITAHVCDALQYAHTHGVIHRDIKPANVLINMEGQVKVADFGLAKGKDAAPGTGLTRTNMTMGTPDFVAPEALIAGMEADHRADLYALGVMLYNMLTGEIPRGRFKPASEKAGCDPRFDAIINKAMESERAERYQTALNLRRDLDVILTTPVARAGDRKGSAALPGQAAQQGIVRKPVMHGPGQAPAHSAAARGGMQPRRSSAGKVAGVLAVMAIIAAGVVFLLKKPAGETQDRGPGETEPVAGTSATPPAGQLAQPSPASPASPGMPADGAGPAREVPADGSWLDVIPLVQLPRDLSQRSPEPLENDWRVEGGVLTAAKSGYLDIVSPELLLPESYDLSLRIKSSLQDGMVGVHVPVGNHHVTVMLAIRNKANNLTGLEAIGGKSVVDGGYTVRPCVLQENTEHLAEIAVRSREGRASVDLRVDGRFVVNWSGKEESLSLWHTWRRMKPRRVGLAASSSGATWREVRVRRAGSGMLPPVTPHGIGAQTEGWTDWLAGVRKSGLTPKGFTWEGEGLRSSGAGYATAICSAAPMRDGALRVTFVPAPGEKLQPTLLIRRSSQPGLLKSYAGSLVPSTRRGVLSVMGKSATVSENHPAALPAGFDPESEFIVELRAEGDVISLFVNGEKASSIRDTSFREGVPAFNAPAGYLVKKVEVLNLDSGPPASTAIPAAGGPATDASKPRSAEAAPVVDLAMRENLRRELVSQWHGDGDARDSAGNNHGTLHNVTFVPGVRAQAFDFAAADSAVAMTAEALNEDYSALTIFAWVNPRSHGAADDNNYGRTVLSRTKDGGFALRVFNGMIQANLRTDARNGKIGFGEKPLPLHQWSMIAITYDGARVLAYQDGKRVGGQGSHGGKIKKTSVPTARLMIGNDPGDDAKDSTKVQRGQFGWDGAIDMVTFYSRALSADEIAAAYELTRKK